MKYFGKLIFIFFVGISSWGCKKDLLRTIPNDRISSEVFWKTDQDATFAANAVYTYMVENANHFMSWDGISDIEYDRTPESSEALILQGQFDALNGRVSNDWDKNYAGIRAANTFLENVDRIETNNSNLMNRLKAEVRVLRAYFYIRLAFLFGDVPLITKDITLEESKTLVRDPVSQVWDFVSGELSDAASDLPLTQSDIGRITKGAALGLKARAMLFAGRFQEAVNAAQQVMDLGVYDLYPSYKNLFSYGAENNTEVILDIQFIKSTFSNNIFSLLAPRSVNGNSTYVPTKNLVDSYDMNSGLPITDPGSGFDPFNPYKNRDPRLGYSVFVPGDVLPDGRVFNPLPTSNTADAVGTSFVVGPTGFNGKKYVNNEDLNDPGNCGINLILLRYAEILLIYAESKIELNQIDNSVYDAINEIRQRPDVNMPVISSGKSQEEMRQIVRHERKIELAMEGLRFFDIRRWRIAADVMPGRVFGITYVNENGQLETVDVPGWEQHWNDRNYLWPIPQKERDLNPNLTQNTGY